MGWHVFVQDHWTSWNDDGFAPKLLPGGKHLMLNEPIKYWICEIQLEKMLQKYKQIRILYKYSVGRINIYVCVIVKLSYKEPFTSLI